MIISNGSIESFEESILWFCLLGLLDKPLVHPMIICKRVYKMRVLNGSIESFKGKLLVISLGPNVKLNVFQYIENHLMSLI